MKRSVSTLLAIPLLGLASCSSSGGPSGGLIGLLTGGTLGALGDHYIGNNQGSDTTIQNANGSTTTIGKDGTVATQQAAANNGTVINTGTTGTTTGTTGTALGTTGTIGSTSGNTIITSSNSGSDVWNNHSGLIVGAASGLAAGAITDAFRQKEIDKKYDEGYAKAKSDSIKEFYWLKRDAQKTMKGGGGDEPPVQYRYYEVEVPAHTTSDGVLIDKHKRIIEVVE